MSCKNRTKVDISPLSDVEGMVTRYFPHPPEWSEPPQDQVIPVERLKPHLDLLPLFFQAMYTDPILAVDILNEANRIKAEREKVTEQWEEFLETASPELIAKRRSQRAGTLRAYAKEAAPGYDGEKYWARKDLIDTKRREQDALRYAANKANKPAVSGTKTCVQCKREKDLTEFGGHPRASDGRIKTCLACKRGSGGV